MQQVLVVANQTLGGDHLSDAIRSCMNEGPCEFWLLVPAATADPRRAPMNFTSTVGYAQGAHEESDAARYAVARERLEWGLERLRAVGATVDGVVGETDALRAISKVMANRQVDRIILSTLPRGRSRWLHQDLPRRVERKFKLPLTVVTFGES